MSSHPRCVPWAAWGEWVWVREALFHEDGERQAEGSRRVLGVWRLRGGVPHAAECTAHLVDCLDSRVGVGDGARLELAMVVIRTVNGLVDAGQASKTAKSVSGLAFALGLPSWLVDIRHQATHNSLPSLELLTAAARELLSYLQVKYWQAQADHLAGDAANCRQTLETYWRASAAPPPEAEARPGEPKKKRQKKVPADVADALSALAPTSVFDIFLDVLVGGGLGCARPADLLVPQSKRFTGDAASFAALQKRSMPLLDRARREWPPFSAALVQKLQKRLLADAVEPRERKLLQSWFRALVEDESWLAGAGTGTRVRGGLWDAMFDAATTSPSAAARAAAAAAAVSLAQSMARKDKRKAKSPRGPAADPRAQPPPSLEDLEAWLAAAAGDAAVAPKTLWRARLVPQSECVGGILAGDA
ncbi:Las1-like-domain-containing protein [Pelagophyceae sp. CCMP2097]|nr:Las1-like-domain-containing protein [Pelagophyceae sp. CCMP2097]